ncbi:MAG: hypothetical protein U5N58_08415 [Actinomycetota bacterium]|nr:hypothetical protein [Actinomycetota bacterium]
MDLYLTLFCQSDKIVEIFIEDWRNLGLNAFATTKRALLGFFIGSFLGVGTAFLMSRSRVFLAIVNPFIMVIKPIPVLALIPLFILWFGLGELGKILFIALGCFFIMNNFARSYS